MNEKNNVAVEEQLLLRKGARIKVIGVGGGGGNAVNNMIDAGVEGVEFAIANTDIQAVEASTAKEKIQMGIKSTRGLGAGAKPEVGRKAAEESMAEIEKMLKGMDMVFIAVGLGGGTGTGAAPVIAEAARKMGILTVGVSTLPFQFEGKSRMKKALEGKAELMKHVDTNITIPNDRLTGHLKSIGKKFDMTKALAEVNNVLLQAVTGITNLITRPGVINTDFADVQTIMSIRGASLMGMGIGTGEERIKEATERAMNNPLLGYGIDGARGVLLNITGNTSLDYDDFVLANQIITGYVHEDAEIIVGTVLDNSIPEDTVYVTVVATGFDEEVDEHGASHVVENKQYPSHEVAVAAAQNQINDLERMVSKEQTSILAQQQNQFQNVSQQLESAGVNFGQNMNQNQTMQPQMDMNAQATLLAQKQAEFEALQRQMAEQQQIMAQMQQAQATAQAQMQQEQATAQAQMQPSFGQTGVVDMQQVMNAQPQEATPQQNVVGQNSGLSAATSNLFAKFNLPEFMQK